MMVMMTLGLVRLLSALSLLRALQVLGQRGKCALGIGEVAGLEGITDCRKVVADLAAPSRLLTVLRPVDSLQILS